MCGSHNTNQKLMDRVIYSLNPETVERVAGSGNKFVHMTEGKSDFYINLVPGFKNWDMCGSEAILQSRFGIVTDSSLSPIQYSESRGSHTIQGGILAAKNTRQLLVGAKRIEKEIGLSLPECQGLIAYDAKLRKFKKLEASVPRPSTQEVNEVRRALMHSL